MDLERQLKELRWCTLCPSCCVLRGTAQSYLLAEKWQQPSEQELGLKGQNKESSFRGGLKLVKTCKCEMFTTFMLSCFSRSCDVPEISACVSYLSDLEENSSLSQPSAAIFQNTCFLLDLVNDKIKVIMQLWLLVILSRYIENHLQIHIQPSVDRNFLFCNPGQI